MAAETLELGPACRQLGLWGALSPTAGRRAAFVGGDEEHGQAAVELALLVPLVAVLLLAVVQVTLVARDQILVVHAAREAAREAAVDRRPAAVRAAALRASELQPQWIDIELVAEETSGIIAVQVRYLSPTRVPLVGPLLPSIALQAKAAMRVEADSLREKTTTLREIQQERRHGPANPA